MHNGVFKLLQRQIYTCLSSRNGLLLCLGGFVLVLVSGFQFGEVVLEWSMNQYASAFNAYHDNIAGRSFQDRLCAPIPIDIVYTWVNGTDPELLENLKSVKLELEAEMNRTREREERRKREEELARNRTLTKVFNQSQENVTATAVEKAKTRTSRKFPITNSSVPESNRKRSVEKPTVSPRQHKLKQVKKKKGKRPGSRGLRGLDVDNRAEDGKGRQSLGIDDAAAGPSRLNLLPPRDNKNKGKDAGNQADKTKSRKALKGVKLSAEKTSEMETKEKSQEGVHQMPLLPPVPGLLDGIQKPESERKDEKENRESKHHSSKKNASTIIAKAPDAVCQGKRCIPAFGLLIEEGLPSNITLNQVKSIHLLFASATEVFRVTSVGSHIETATYVQFPYQRAVLDASKVIVPWLNKNLTSAIGFLTADETLLLSVVLPQLVLVTGFPANVTQLELTTALVGRFKSHVVSATLHTNLSLAVVKFDNKTYVEDVLKLSKGNVTVRKHPIVFQAARLVWNPLSPTVAPSKDKKDKLDEVSDIFSANRFQDNEELRYSLRSIEKYSPWVRHIYLVTNGQIPYWLDLDNPRLTIVSHKDIFLNQSHLPTFSSPAIETHIHRIPGLSKKFIYLNDDVLFGQDIWPDDFYTNTDGQKVYLAWQVPHCAEGCPPTWITDKYCDKACNNSACDWDGGDCVGVSGRAASMYKGWHGAHGGLQFDPSRFCNTGCADTWMGDKYCDTTCNVFDCGFDVGDCGVTSFDKLYGIDVTHNLSTVHLPLGLKSVYFNLTAVMDRRKITEGDVTKSDVVRVAVVAQRYKMLSIVLRPGQNLTLLSIRIISNEVNKTKITVQFNITVDTVTAPPALATAVPENKMLANITDSNKTMAVTVQNGTQAFNFWEEDIPVPRHPQPFNTLEYAVPLFRNGTILPADVVSQLLTLQHDYKIGDLTERGYYRRKAKILNEYLEQNQSAGRMVFGSKLPRMTSVTSVKDRNVSEQLAGGGEKTTADLSEKREMNGTEGGLKDIRHNKDVSDQSLLNKAATQRKILWINELYDPIDEDHSFDRTDDDLFVADWIANSKKKQLQLHEELERTRNQWIENHRPQSPAGFQTRGVLPWEKQQVFDALIAEKLSEEAYSTSHVGSQRKLMDAFADSLKYVNKLYNKQYGYAARKVPAHSPHMIDTDVMTELQSKFPSEYESTSSHQLRHPKDMQFAFSYYYYLMSEKVEFNLTEIFDTLDTDQSGILSYRELRTLMARIHDLPITLKIMEKFEKTLYNCSKSANYTIPSVSELDMEYNYDDDVPLITLELLSQCQPIIELMNKSYSSRSMFKSEVMGEDDIAFKMIEDNVTKTVQQLDWIRRNTRKFICLNDNIDHRKPDSVMVKALIRDFLESLFPKRSQFELPPEYRNRFLHVDELEEWRQQRETVRFWTHVAFAVLLTITLASFFVGQLKGLRRKWHNFSTRLRGQRGRGRFVAV